MLILASTSPTRATLLKAAGVPFTVEPAGVDEDDLKCACRDDGLTAAEAAEALAELKARRIAMRHPDALVLGCDQMLDCGGQWFDKPGDIEQARSQLLALRGRKHTLISSAVIMKGESRLWHTTDTATLTMRPFSAGFLDSYLAAEGEEISHCVGGYRLENLGVQLFSKVEGDHFTVLGIPMLPLLGFLRNHGLIQE